MSAELEGLGTHLDEIDLTFGEIRRAGQVS